MRSSRRKNWFFKRVALGFAVAALAAPVAQAKVDEGSSVAQAVKSGQVQLRRDPVQMVGLQSLSTGNDIVAADYGMPRATPADYAMSSGDQIEVVRAQPGSSSSDKIEFVRTKPRSIGEPQVVAAGFDWNDGAIGAGLALGLVLLGAGAAAATRHLGREQTA